MPSRMLSSGSFLSSVNSAATRGEGQAIVGCMTVEVGEGEGSERPSIGGVRSSYESNVPDPCTSHPARHNLQNRQQKDDVPTLKGVKCQLLPRQSDAAFGKRYSLLLDLTQERKSRTQVT